MKQVAEKSIQSSFLVLMKDNMKINKHIIRQKKLQRLLF